jgi:hypothetical protein
MLHGAKPFEILRSVAGTIRKTAELGTKLLFPRKSKNLIQTGPFGDLFD